MAPKKILHRAAKTGHIISRAHGEKIIAVEGMKQTREMKERAADFDRRGLIREERRRAIIAAHRN